MDTVVINPLRSLYDMDFQGAYYIACTHVGRILTKVNQLRLKTERTTPYINTGVMLLNLPPLRRALRLSDVRSYVDMKRHALLLPDQDILTALYGGHIRQADPLLYNLSDTLLLNYSADPRTPESTSTGSGSTPSSSTTAAETNPGGSTTSARSACSIRSCPKHRKWRRSPSSSDRIQTKEANCT